MNNNKIKETMKLYIVTETNKENNMMLRSWVCFSKEEANECLKVRYELACTYNRIAGVSDPIDCLDYGFFFWSLSDGQELKYNIEETKTFVE